jgi:hypothetical protein
MESENDYRQMFDSTVGPAGASDESGSQSKMEPSAGSAQPVFDNVGAK